MIVLYKKHVICLADLRGRGEENHTYTFQLSQKWWSDILKLKNCWQHKRNS